MDFHITKILKEIIAICCPVYILVARSKHIYATVVARTQNNLRIFCVKEIAYILGLCKVLRLFHVCVQSHTKQPGPLQASG